MCAVSTCPASSSKPRARRPRGRGARHTRGWPSLFVICYAYAGRIPPIRGLYVVCGACVCPDYILRPQTRRTGAAARPCARHGSRATGV